MCEVGDDWILFRFLLYFTSLWVALLCLLLAAMRCLPSFVFCPHFTLTSGYQAFFKAVARCFHGCEYIYNLCICFSALFRCCFAVRQLLLLYLNICENTSVFPYCSLLFLVFLQYMYIPMCIPIYFIIHVYFFSPSMFFCTHCLPPLACSAAAKFKSRGHLHSVIVFASIFHFFLRLVLLLFFLNIFYPAIINTHSFKTMNLCAIFCSHQFTCSSLHNLFSELPCVFLFSFAGISNVSVHLRIVHFLHTCMSKCIVLLNKCKCYVYGCMYVCKYVTLWH